MGLFTNNKKPCPICGEGTPRLLATYITDKTPICSDCATKISLVDTQVRELSVEGLREHLAQREENAKYLESTFRPNKKITIGWTSLNIDEANKVFTIPLNMCGNTNNPPVFKFEELIGYELLEEDCVIERFNKGDAAPLCTPTVYAPAIHGVPFDFRDKDEKPQNISRSFKLNLYLTNPDWDKVESSAGSVFEDKYDFQRKYNKHIGELRMVTAAIAAIIGVAPAGAAEQGEAGDIA